MSYSPPVVYKYAPSIDQLIDWLIDWFIDWFITFFRGDERPNFNGSDTIFCQINKKRRCESSYSSSVKEEKSVVHILCWAQKWDCWWNRISCWLLGPPILLLLIHHVLDTSRFFSIIFCSCWNIFFKMKILFYLGLMAHINCPPYFNCETTLLRKNYNNTTAQFSTQCKPFRETIQKNSRTYRVPEKILKFVQVMRKSLCQCHRVPCGIHQPFYLFIFFESFPAASS